jgi:putative transposase
MRYGSCQHSDYSNRWKYIKTLFTRGLLEKGLELKKDRRGEYALWQRRFWEHTADAVDLKRHADYIHYNPVKHRREKY